MKPSEILKDIASSKNTKVSYIEKELDVPYGYFSRKKSFDGMKLGIALKLEKILDMDIHEIINHKIVKKVMVEMTEEEYNEFLKLKEDRSWENEKKSI